MVGRTPRSDRSVVAAGPWLYEIHGTSRAPWVFPTSEGNRPHRDAVKPTLNMLRGRRPNGTSSSHKLAKKREPLIPRDVNLHDMRRTVADRMLNALSVSAYVVDIGVLGHVKPELLGGLKELVVVDDASADHVKVAKEVFAGRARFLDVAVDPPVYRDEAKAPNLSSKTLTEYRRMVSAYVEGTSLGRTSSRAIRRADVKACLEDIARKGPVMSNRVFQLVRATLRFAVREDSIPARNSNGRERRKSANVSWRTMRSRFSGERSIKSRRK